MTISATFDPIRKVVSSLIRKRWTGFCVVAALGAGFPSTAESESPTSEPIQALLIAGGCCHDYPKQNVILPNGISSRANVEWSVVLQGGSSRGDKIKIYEDENWAEPYDVVVHNECFGSVDDVAWVKRIVRQHTEAGVPGLFIHCSMHSYRAADSNDWQKLLGVTSRSHEGHRPFEVENLKPNHPIMKGFPDVWETPNGELYKIEKLWPDAIPLARAYGKDTQRYHTSIWVNYYGNARVFATTIGHHNETMESDVYLDLVTRGLLWSVGKLGVDGKPVAGYGATE